MTLIHDLTIPALPAISTPRAPAVGPRSIAGSHRVHGRAEAISRTIEVCASASTTPIVAVTGPAGIGRSAVLAEVRTRLCEQGISTAEVRMTRDEPDLAHLVGRLADELGVPIARGNSGRNLLKRVLATVTERVGRLVVFLDDAQRIDPRSLADLARAIGAVSRDRVRFVCAFRTPAVEARSELEMLRAGELVHEEPLRPLGEVAIRHALEERLEAKPTRELVATVRTASRGIPAFLHAALDGYLNANALRVVDRHACLAGNRTPHLNIKHSLFAGLRELGSPRWPMIKALAVLHPLRGPIEALIAEVVGISEHRVVEVLRALSQAGILRARPNGWRFRVPMLATALLSCLGPYERRRISELAVTALWDGRASCADDNYLPERLVDAGRLVDPRRAASALLVHAATVAPHDGDLADRWGRAASRLITDPAQRAAVLHRHAVTCALHLRFDSATDTVDTVLRAYPDQLAADALHELHILRVVVSASCGNLAALREIVDDASVPRGQARQTVIRATALCMLDRWSEAYEELNRDPWLWRGVDVSTGVFAQVIREAVCSVLGTTSGADTTGSAWSSGNIRATGTTAEVLLVLVRSLAVAGGVDESDRRPALPEREPTAGELAIRAGVSGRWDEALDRTRSSIAHASACGQAPGQTGVFRCMADILIARGQLSRARTVLETARSQHLLLPHLLAVAEAEMERTVGEHERARARVEQGLSQAAESGVLAGTDELLLWMTESELRRGDRPAAGRCLAQLERVAGQLDTTDARLNHALARVLVHRDGEAAEEAIAIAEERGRPFELARTLTTVAGSGLGDDKTMHRAYELFGELDALVPRARVRQLMRERQVAVPGRGTTVFENERLLATLIAEGLSNSDLAVILGTSEKGVEGRLSRLFQRGGYRSRAELAAVTINEEFPEIRSVSSEERWCSA